MHILLTNDDGYEAEGIRVLSEALRLAGHRTTIIAPHEERSGQSHAMTFFRPVLVRQLEANLYSVFGTPADCVVTGLLDILKNDLPDLVISGINRGLNVGADTNYSGTVGAATEAALIGHRAIAISTDIHIHDEVKNNHNLSYQRAAALAVGVIANIDRIHWARHEVLNINHPGIVPLGVRTAHSAGRSMFIPNVEKLVPQGGPHSENSSVYLIGGGVGTKKDLDLSDGQDVSLIFQGYATLSFLQARTSSTANNDSLELLAKSL